jgi:hypothetical protein
VELAFQPFAPGLKEEVRAAVDSDAEAWAIMPINPTGERFEAYWAAACSASPNERMVYAIRNIAVDRQLAGTRPTIGR